MNRYSKSEIQRRDEIKVILDQQAGKVADADPVSRESVLEHAAIEMGKIIAVKEFGDSGEFVVTNSLTSASHACGVDRGRAGKIIAAGLKEGARQRLIATEAELQKLFRDIAAEESRTDQFEVEFGKYGMNELSGWSKAILGQHDIARHLGMNRSFSGEGAFSFEEKVQVVMDYIAKLGREFIAIAGKLGLSDAELPQCLQEFFSKVRKFEVAA